MNSDALSPTPLVNDSEDESGLGADFNRKDNGTQMAPSMKVSKSGENNLERHNDAGGPNHLKSPHGAKK